MTTRNKRSVQKRTAGFTMIEVVVASAIMSLVFIAMLGAVSTARNVQSLSENRLACIHIARETLEQYSTLSYDSAAFAVGTNQLPNNRGAVVIKAVSGQTTKDVTVTINWVEPTKKTYSVSLTSSFSRSLHR
jgi:prepilin-type N-terminal cleavage/methylation domain-containing protein